jgi:hypothetical protein
MYILDYSKDEFDKESETEIFEADLFPTATATAKNSLSKLNPVSLKLITANVLYESPSGYKNNNERLNNIIYNINNYNADIICFKESKKDLIVPNYDIIAQNINVNIHDYINTFTPLKIVLIINIKNTYNTI